MRLYGTHYCLKAISLFICLLICFSPEEFLEQSNTHLFKEVDQSPWSVLAWVGSHLLEGRKRKWREGRKRGMGRRRDNKKEERGKWGCKEEDRRESTFFPRDSPLGWECIFSGSKTVVLTASQAPPDHSTENLHSRVHLHSEVGDESCSWNLHLKRDFLVPRPSVEHPTRNCGERSRRWW